MTTFQERVKNLPVCIPAERGDYEGRRASLIGLRDKCATIAAEADSALAAAQERIGGLERARDNYKLGFNHAIREVDKVFQVCAENPNPILPDFLPLGTDKFEGVVKLAKAYRKLRDRCEIAEQAKAGVLEDFVEIQKEVARLQSQLTTVTAERDEAMIEINRLITALEDVRDLDGAFHGGHQFPANVKHPHEVATQALAGHKTLMQQRWEWQGEEIQRQKSRAGQAESRLAEVERDAARLREALQDVLAGEDGNAIAPKCTIPTWLDDHEDCCKDAYQRGWDAAVEEIGDCNDR